MAGKKWTDGTIPVATELTGEEIMMSVQGGESTAVEFSLIDSTILDKAKTYADGLVVGLLDDRGNWDASGNTYPNTGGSGALGAIKKGDLWRISVAGALSGVAVSVGDAVRALVDTPAQTGANWAIMEEAGTPTLQQVTAAGNTTDRQIVSTDNIISTHPSSFSYAGLTIDGEMRLSNSAGKEVLINAGNQTAPLGPGTPNVIQLPNESCTLQAKKWKFFECYLVQSGTADPYNPTGTPVENDLTGATTFSRLGVGDYQINNTGGFAGIVVGVVVPSVENFQYLIFRTSDNACSLQQFDMAGAPVDVFTGIYIMIKVKI